MMRTIILPLLLLLAYPSAALADPTRSVPPLAVPQSRQAPPSAHRPIADSARKATASLTLSVERSREPETDREPGSWTARHPVWTGLLVGAGVGAAQGALSCRNGCFPLGQSGAMTIGAGYGAGIGALLGWVIGAANRNAP